MRSTLLLCGALGLLAACPESPSASDAGLVPSTDDAGALLDAGDPTGEPGGGAGVDAGPRDGGGSPDDAGIPPDDASPGDGSDGGAPVDGGDDVGPSCDAPPTAPEVLPSDGPWCFGCTCFDEPFPSDLHYGAVWVAPEGDAWFATEDGRVIRWRNGAFERMPVPPGTLVWRIDIDGTSADDVWIAGGEGGVFHWDGLAMGFVPLESDITYYGLDVRAVDDVWVQGDEPPYDARYVHFDGSTWTLMAASAPRTATFDVVDDGTLWGAGDGLHRWDGTQWTSLITDAELPSGSTLVRSVAISSSDVWVGGDLRMNDGWSPALFHWNGTALTDESWPAGGGILDLWRSPSGTLWAVTHWGATWRRDAAGWQQVHEAEEYVSPPDVFFIVHSISGRSDDDVWVAGPGGRLRRFHDGAWTYFPASSAP